MQKHDVLHMSFGYVVSLALDSLIVSQRDNKESEKLLKRLESRFIILHLKIPLSPFPLNYIILNCSNMSFSKAPLKRFNDFENGKNCTTYIIVLHVVRYAS